MHLAVNVVKFLRRHQIKWYMISTWTGPRSLHDLVCRRVVSFHSFFFCVILLRPLPDSGTPWPKLFPKHPQIIQNILLQVWCRLPRWRQVLPEPDGASGDVGTFEASVSSCQVQFLTATSNTSNNICWPDMAAQRCMIKDRSHVGVGWSGLPTQIILQHDISYIEL